MKTGWRQYATRKDKLETVALRCRNMTYSQSAIAWQKLTAKMLELSDPSGPRIPKFNDLLLAVVSSSVRADHRATGIGWVPEDQKPKFEKIRVEGADFEIPEEI